MSGRTWDRIGSATGAIAVVLSLGGLLVGGAAGRAVRPNWDASTDLIVAFASRPVSGLSFMAGVVSTAFLHLAVFIVKLLFGLRRAEGGTGWLSASGIAGGIIYLAFDLIRFMLGTAHGLAVGHHLTSGEATALFDLTNAMTPYTWGAIAMLLIPTGVVVIRTGALPGWLGWAAVVIGLANLVWAWLPPGGSATPAEFAFILWILVTSVLLAWRPMATNSKGVVRFGTSSTNLQSRGIRRSNSST